MERGSLGSAYVSTSKTTQQQTRMLESSGVSIKAGASASFWGTTAGTSVLNSKEQEAGSYFSSVKMTPPRASSPARSRWRAHQVVRPRGTCTGAEPA